MGKGNIVKFVVLLFLSVVVTYVAEIIDALMSGNVLSGAAGFPFKYGYSSFFGGSTIDYKILAADILFWFVVLFMIWGIIRRVLSKS